MVTVNTNGGHGRLTFDTGQRMQQKLKDERYITVVFKKRLWDRFGTVYRDLMAGKESHVYHIRTVHFLSI